MLELSKCICEDSARFVRALVPQKSNPAAFTALFQILCNTDGCRKSGWKKSLSAAIEDWNQKIKTETSMLKAMAKVK